MQTRLSGASRWSALETILDGGFSNGPMGNFRPELTLDGACSWRFGVNGGEIARIQSVFTLGAGSPHSLAPGRHPWKMSERQCRLQSDLDFLTAVVFDGDRLPSFRQWFRYLDESLKAACAGSHSKEQGRRGWIPTKDGSMSFEIAILSNLSSQKSPQAADRRHDRGVGIRQNR